MKRLQPIAIFLFLFLVCTLTAHAQIGIGTTTPDPNAALDIESTSQGVLIPRMLKSQRELIGGGSPAAGMLVYQTDDVAGFYFYNGTAWVSLSAKTPSGLETLDEGNGNGLVRVGRDPANYGNVGENAVDFSFSDALSTTYGATGDYSTAMGWKTEASGTYSTAMGSFTTAIGQYSTAMGFQTEALGGLSTAMGWQTIALRNYSTAMGFQTEGFGDVSTALGSFTTAFGDVSTALGLDTQAESYASTAIGLYNVGGGNPISFITTDPLFEIGNGTSDSNRSNALTVLKNGTITAPSFDISEITNDKALITKEYADANLNSGLKSLDEGNGNGLVKAGRNPNNYGNVGLNAVDLSYSNVPSASFGATGDYSTAMGDQTEASGFGSTAMGISTTASGSVSTAMGSFTTASQISSTAMGRSTTASGFHSTALGEGTQAESYASTALGRYNVGGGSPSSIITTDPLFEIGNGTSESNRSNVLTVLRNGNVGVGTISPSQALSVIGNTEITGNVGIGTASPIAKLDVNGNAYVNGNIGIGATNPSDKLVIEGGRLEVLADIDASGLPGTGSIEVANSLRIDRNEIITNTDSPLFLQQGNNGNLIVDNGTLVVDSFYNRVGIGTSSPSQALHVIGNAEINGSVIANGLVLGQRVAFTGFQDADVTLGNSSPTLSLVFSDVTDNFNTLNSGVFTAPLSGLYFFSCSLSFSEGDGLDDTMWFGFSVNGSSGMVTESIFNPRTYTSGGREQAYSHSAVISLNTGDTVEVLIRDISTTSPVEVLDRTFTGYYLGGN